LVTSLTGEPAVERVMRTGVGTIRPDQPLIEVALALRDAAISSLPVVDESSALVGIVSEYDVLGKPGATAQDVMSRGVITVSADAAVTDAARLMGQHGIHVIPVVDGAQVLGVVTRSDLIGLFAETRWICSACGVKTFGLFRPKACLACGGAMVRLDAEG